MSSKNQLVNLGSVRSASPESAFETFNIRARLALLKAFGCGVPRSIHEPSSFPRCVGCTIDWNL